MSERMLTSRLPSTTLIQTTGASQPALSLTRKLLYGLGDITNAIKTTVFTLFTLFFYTTVMGLSASLVGIVAGVGLIWDGMIDPYIGYWSDRVSTRLGRRHPFMLAGALTMGVSLWLFLSPPQGMGAAGLFLWALVTSLMVRTSTSLFLIPYFALGAELSSDYHERTSVSGVRSALAMIGTLLASSLSFVLFFPDSGSSGDPKMVYAGYPAMGLVYGLAMTVLGLIATVSTLPFALSTQLPPDGQAAHQATEAPSTFFATFWELLRNRSFLILFISFSLFFWGVVTALALSIHYFTYYVKITDSAALSSFQAAFYLGGSAGIIGWIAAAKRMEKKLIYMAAAAITALILLCAYLLLGEGRPLGVGNAGAVLAGHALAGIFASVVWFLPWSLMADIADEDELATGRRREGAIIGIFFLGQQLASGLSVILVGALLEWYAGLEAGAVEQSAQTIDRIGVLFGVLPAALVLIAALIASRYRLNRQRVAEIQRKLTRFRVQRMGE